VQARSFQIARMAIDPTREAFEQFMTSDTTTPVVMLNLLRFADRSGYEAYLRATAPFLAKVGGEVVYAGLGGDALVAEAGQAWDAVLLVRYPSRAAFAAMVADRDYREVTKLRASALVEAVLQPTTPWPGVNPR
jgi:uncharacterized protein (DUF1330 family)